SAGIHERERARSARRYMLGEVDAAIRAFAERSHDPIVPRDDRAGEIRRGPLRAKDDAIVLAKLDSGRVCGPALWADVRSWHAESRTNRPGGYSAECRIELAARGDGPQAARAYGPRRNRDHRDAATPAHSPCCELAGAATPSAVCSLVLW